MTKMDILIGSVRRIGRHGPPYEMIGRAAIASDGEAQMRMHMIESDEDLDYALKDPLDD